MNRMSDHQSMSGDSWIHVLFLLLLLYFSFCVCNIITGQYYSAQCPYCTIYFSGVLECDVNELCYISPNAGCYSPVTF